MSGAGAVVSGLEVVVCGLGVVVSEGVPGGSTNIFTKMFVGNEVSVGKFRVHLGGG